MIITKLIGGLGNQMFQYAAGRRAAYVNNTDLKLDITGYENQDGITPREYLLHIFNIKDAFATLDEIQKLKGSGRNFFFRYFLKLIKRMIPYYKQSYIRQKDFLFDPNILDVGKNTYFEGSWSSEKYFKDIEEVLRRDFTFKGKPDKENKKIIKTLRSLNAVSLHIRRGDYVNIPRTSRFHGVCSKEYYCRACSIVAQKVKSPHFFVFSDDPEWVKRNFHLPYPIRIIDHNFQKKDYEDMRLMSLCKHNIIANSSFSWWGAWLNRHKNKIVIAPRQWFKEGMLDTRDLVPSSWIRI